MPSTATVVIVGTVVGQPESGSNEFNITQTNSTSPSFWTAVVAATAQGAASPVTFSANGRFAVIIPPGTNTLPFNIASSTAAADIGIRLSSNLASVVALAPGSTWFFYTTGTSAISNIRVGTL